MNKPLPGLYIIATPIGDYNDVGLRALDVLRQCHLIACEDTRVTYGLLKHHDIHERPLMVYNDHATPRDRQRIVMAIAEGQSVALVSDAGMPLISDPGYKLLEAVREQALPLTVIPGPSAVITALVLSGLPPHPFFFEGFLPSTQTARLSQLQRWTSYNGTIVCYEAPHRLCATLADMAALWKDAREVAVIREMTKRFESVRTGTAAELQAYYQASDECRGEIVLVVGPLRHAIEPLEAHRGVITQLLQHCSARDITDILEHFTSFPKRDIYKYVDALKKGQSEK